MREPLAKPPFPRHPTRSTKRAMPDYDRARFEWNDRYASLAKGKRNWQLVGLALLLINVALSSATTAVSVSPSSLRSESSGSSRKL